MKLAYAAWVMSRSLVLRPIFSFDSIASELNDLDWQREPDRSVTAPFIPGEPELAAWHDAEGRNRIVYTFNPAISLRVLAFHGPEAAQLMPEAARHLPVLGIDDLRTLLQASDSTHLLLGLLAAGEMGAAVVIEEVASLRNHPEALVTRAAMRVHEQLARVIVQMGVERLQGEKARHPARSVLFPRLGDVYQRRQILRWLAHDNERSNPDIDATLRSALIDPDWEMRVTAILVAARLRATNVGLAVRSVELPKSSRQGVDPTDRRMLVAMRDAAILLLSGQPVPPPLAEAPVGREQLWAHMLRCVAGQPVALEDRVFLLTYALTQPLDDDWPAPVSLPTGVRQHGDSYRLHQVDIELVWVPPVPHWLGDAWDGATPLPVIRQVKPQSGFFIARRPLSSVDVRRWVAHLVQSPGQERGDYAYLAWPAAQELCALLRQVTDAAIAIASADEWEMAARGPDGRRYPWSNGADATGIRQPSPWGCEDTVGILAQWTTTVDELGRRLICGGPTQLRCAYRVPIRSDVENAGLRLVVR